jgi:NAD(P)-dependent dehydrogenase (short-subunit alcohol dehydrogenase family)
MGRGIATRLLAGGHSVTLVGRRPARAGAARQLEALALLGITIQGRLGTGFKSGWKLLVPQA